MDEVKDRICNVLIVLAMLALVGAGFREYLIHNGRLTSDMNADGHSITNLPGGFFPVESVNGMTGAVTVPPSLPSGLPTTTIFSPTLRASLSPHTEAESPVASILMTAISASASRPMRRAAYSSPLRSLTTILSARVLPLSVSETT